MKTKDLEGTLKTIINKYLEEKSISLTEYEERIKSTATYDLYWGPIVSTNADIEDLLDTEGLVYEGFESACEILSKKADLLPRELWVDIAAEYCMEREPDSSWFNEDTGEWEEEYLEDTYLVKNADIKRYVFGKELSQYV